jgi:hypothetical protein
MAEEKPGTHFSRLLKSPPSFDREAAWDWINKHWKGTRVCPVCQANQWSIVPDSLVKLPTEMFDNVIPAVLLVCLNCAFVRFFSAAMMGVRVPGDYGK